MRSICYEKICLVYEYGDPKQVKIIHLGTHEVLAENNICYDEYAHMSRHIS